MSEWVDELASAVKGCEQEVIELKALLGHVYKMTRPGPKGGYKERLDTIQDMTAPYAET